MVIKLEGVVDSVPVVFTRRDGDWWETTVPKTLNGVYVVELTATDEAGNIAYTAKYILTIDITALRVKLQRYPYSASNHISNRCHSLSPFHISCISIYELFSKNHHPDVPSLFCNEPLFCDHRKVALFS